MSTNADVLGRWSGESRGRIGSERALRAIVPLGRVFLSLIFILSGIGHFSPASIAAAAAQGVPLPGILVPASGVLALAGGLSILLGFHARLGAWLLVAFLMPVTLSMHAFWAESSPMMAGMQQAMFMKNVGLLGGVLLVTHFGAGPISLDARRSERSA